MCEHARLARSGSRFTVDDESLGRDGRSADVLYRSYVGATARQEPYACAAVLYIFYSFHVLAGSSERYDGVVACSNKYTDVVIVTVCVCFRCNTIVYRVG